MSDERKQMKTGIELIAAERERQVSKLGWTPEHDDEHDGMELALAAACYVTPGGPMGGLRRVRDGVPHLWPWDKKYWKPSDNRIGELVKAGALIVAEIERLQRVTSRTAGDAEGGR